MISPASFSIMVFSPRLREYSMSQRIAKATPDGLFLANCVAHTENTDVGSGTTIDNVTIGAALGVAAAAFTIGRRWRQDAEPLFNRLTNLNDETSDWVTSASVDLGEHLAGDFDEETVEYPGVPVTEDGGDFRSGHA